MPTRTRTAIAAIALALATTATVACSGARAAPNAATAPTTPPPAQPTASAAAPIASLPSSAPEAAPAPTTDDTGEEVPPPEPVVMIPARGPLRLTVKVEPSDDLDVEEARDFYLSIGVANPSRHAIKIDMTQSVLQVNGKPLKQWKGTAVSLPTDGKWRELQPGQSVQFLFKFANKVRVTPGEYGFVLRVGDSNSATVKLQVRQ